MTGINPYGVPLDELAAPSDVTTLNATTSAHGLLRKLSGSTSEYLRGDGTWAGISAGTPGGSSGQVQYNNSGAFGGAAGLAWSASSPNLSLTSQGDAHVPLCVQLTASATGDGTQWKDSAGTKRVYIRTQSNQPAQLAFDSDMGYVFWRNSSGTNRALIGRANGDDAYMWFYPYSGISGWLFTNPSGNNGGLRVDATSAGKSGFNLYSTTPSAHLQVNGLTTTVDTLRVKMVASQTAPAINVVNSSDVTQFSANATKELFIGNVASAPGVSPSLGGYLYVESGALKYMGSSGTVTPLAAA